jgi:hypothetical protein
MNELGISSYNTSSVSEAAYTAIQFFHNVPRFGFPNDVTLLASRNPMDAKTYIKGAALPTFCFLFIFLSWCLFLIVCWCLGRKKVGFLSGSPFVVVVEKQAFSCSLHDTKSTLSGDVATSDCLDHKAVSTVSLDAATNLWSGVIGTVGNNTQPIDQQKYRRRGRYLKTFVRQCLNTMSQYFQTCSACCDRRFRPRTIRIVCLASGVLLCGSLIILSVVGTKEIRATSVSLKESGMVSSLLTFR